MVIVAVDVGGTFTDFIYVDENNQLRYFKVLSTPRNPEQAVLHGLKRIMGVEEVVHASTIATNAIRGQIGLELPKTALITTRGFRDVIEIGRQNRPRLYDLFFDKPKPLIPRDLRFEIDERTDAYGNILKRVDPLMVEELGKILSSIGVESIAVCFLHSIVNPTNEVITGEVLSKYFKYISLSHRVACEPREYERFSTTVLNAVLMPVIAKYIESIEEYLRSRGVERFYIMSSNGGLIDVYEAKMKPIQLIESGPAAGIVAVSEFSRLINERRVIGFDMGGTTAKAGVVVDYEPLIVSEYEVGGESHHGRIVKGSGYPVRSPFIDLVEVSAGGGTIIWRDDAGALHVGPLSAGSDPGPACYGLGGVEPTITDANLVLNRISNSFLGGEMKLSYDHAWMALKKLGDPVEVAITAIDLINLEMARAIRLVTIERGLNPGDFTLVAYGGAGPQHGVELADEIGIRRVIIPPYPEVFSALGLLLSDWRFEARRSYPRELESEYQLLESELLKRNGRVDYFIRYADVRYVGQGWELIVPVGRPASLEDVKKRFEEKHYATYGFKLDRDVEIVTIRVFGVVKRSKPVLKPVVKYGGVLKSRSYRYAYIGGEWVNTPVYNRVDLGVGSVLEGPAIIEEYGSTTIIPHGWIARIGSYGEIVAERV